MSYHWTNPTRLATDCPMCGRPMARRARRDGTGAFLGCTAYPRCTFVEALDLNLARIERELEAARSDVAYLRDLCAHLTSEIDKGKP